MTELERQVASHYGRKNLLESILDGLKAQGSDLDNLTPEDIAPVDEFHTAGRITTLKALDLAPIQPGMHLLDAGCGIGGTARHLAIERGCYVTGVDLTPQYIEVANALSDRMGLANKCEFHVGNITSLKFEDRRFDGIVNFHVAMNIDDRSTLYNEFFRVLKPGAFLCIFDVLKGPGNGMRYPVPWSEDGTTSFLRSRNEMLELLKTSGFKISAEENLREFALEFFAKVFANAASAEGPPPVGLHLLTGKNSPEKFQNYYHALQDHQIEPAIIVGVKS
ncbi:MAG: class I SAM-dependent methyltransferase [Pseudomonadota bacterium]